MRIPLTFILVLVTSTMTVGQRIRVASWNITDDDARSAVRPQHMADHLRLLNIDILALNHIDGNGDRRSARLDSIFAHANKNEGQDWEYVLFSNRTISDRSALTGLAWNRDRVAMVNNAFRTETDYESLWTKPPYAAKFSAGTGLTDVVVMPVQFEPKDPQNECLAGVRGREAQDLAPRVSLVQQEFGDRDIIVVGDTDCLRDDASSIARLANDDQGLLLPIGNVETFTFARAEFSRVMVPMSQPEFRNTRWYDISQADGLSSDTNLSDHFVLIAPIRIQADDD